MSFFDMRNLKKMFDKVLLGKANYLEWKASVLHMYRSCTKEELENNIKKIEIILRRNELNIKNKQIGFFSTAISLAILFITIMTNGIISINSLSINTAISFKERDQEILSILGENINMQMEYINTICAGIFFLTIIVLCIALVMYNLRKAKINNILFQEELLEILCETCES